jgi:hypothetical protein
MFDSFFLIPYVLKKSLICSFKIFSLLNLTRPCLLDLSHTVVKLIKTRKNRVFRVNIKYETPNIGFSGFVSDIGFSRYAPEYLKKIGFVSMIFLNFILIKNYPPKSKSVLIDLV